MSRAIPAGALVLAASALAANAAVPSTTKNLDITVTHSGSTTSALTSYTFYNVGPDLPAGFPITLGQAFRRGDIPSGSHPECRAATGAALACQWDETSTYHQNGGDKSWHFGSWSVWLPTALPAGATYTVSFAAAPGVYSQASRQPISAVCGGGHHPVLRLTDVRNQDDSKRGTGALSFDLCAATNATGRDAPLRYAAGNIRDGYQLRGQFTYDITGAIDPLLYAVCDVDLYTSAADRSSLGRIKLVCTVHNSFLRVAAGTSGIAGNPGPAGFPNDPQMITYRPALTDGQTMLLDWSGLETTIQSSANPVQTAGCGTNDVSATIPACMTVPSSVGPNSWHYGQAVRAHCSGGCLGGLVDGGLYYIYPTGTANNHGASTTLVTLQAGPSPLFGGNPYSLNGSQGTGSTTFSHVVSHTGHEAWMTLGTDGSEPWIERPGPATFHDVLPAFKQAEKVYWAQTGAFLPLDLTQTGMNAGVWWAQGGSPYYHPGGKNNIEGTSGGGDRPDIGPISGWAAEAQIRGAASDWQLERQFTLSQPTYDFMDYVNEATGRIPAWNNGPPVGPAGNGIGQRYAILGAPLPNDNVGTIAQYRQAGPVAGIDYSCGFWNCLNETDVAHEPSFNSYSYLVWGRRHLLDLMYMHGGRGPAAQNPGPGESYRSHNVNGTTFYGLFHACCQFRGGTWMFRDFIGPAAFGPDADEEAAYYSDLIAENSAYYPLLLKWKDGPGSTGFSTSLTLPNDSGFGFSIESFIAFGYQGTTAYYGKVNLNAPIADAWNAQTARYLEGVAGGRAANAPNTYYAFDYNFTAAIHDPAGPFQGRGSIGPLMNGVDAADWGGACCDSYLGSGGKWTIQGGPAYHLSPGDGVRSITTAYSPAITVDQLPGNTWFKIHDQDYANNTYTILCPAGHAVDATCPNPGTGPFVDYTRNGVSLANDGVGYGNVFRPKYDPGPCMGYSSPNYIQFGGVAIYALTLLGYDVHNAMAEFNRRCGAQYFNSVSDSAYVWELALKVTLP